MNHPTHATAQVAASAVSSTAAPCTSATGTAESGKPVATVVPDAQRMRFLPKHFGIDMMVGEATVFDSMRRICPSYHGGLWDFVEVSNGAFYMRLQSSELQDIDMSAENGYTGQMSADAAGITATLFALNQLIWGGRERFTDAFYLLREFAAQHPEFREIFGAID